VFLRRQQSNDNLLLTHQLATMLDLGERWRVDLGAAYNTIRGLEPDRRENLLYMLDRPEPDGSRYALSGSNRQKRFFSTLDERDLNLRGSLSFKLKRDMSIEKSNVTLGYRGRIVDNSFRAIEYNLGGSPGFYRIDDLDLDEIYNEANRAAGKFSMAKGDENRYNVSKKIHSAYVDATHQLSGRLALNAGVRFDVVGMTVNYVTDARAAGAEKIDKQYWLPSLSLRYTPANRHSLRLGASKSYTLPQSKEIAPYQYVNIGFVSEGNPKIKPSDNYNVDLKWDWYISPAELLSLGAFYKYVTTPIGRVDVGASAGGLKYDNIGEKADVAGVELEMRKNIFERNMGRGRFNRLSVGANASYIFSTLEFTFSDKPRRAQLEGASPFLVNGDVSYNYTAGGTSFTASLVVNYFSPRIHTLGTREYKDIVEEGVATLSFVSSVMINKHITVKFKAGNLLDPTHRLTREYRTKEGKLTLSEYRKGVDVSLGISFSL
jgi:TonB-dependent receptor